MKEAKVLFPCSRIQLEGLLNIQEALPVRGGVVLCHPHPQYGGDMRSMVIASALEAASLEGWSTLRFNFRGVGASQGSYEEGIGEQEDVEAAIDYLSSTMGNDHAPIILVGYSFGAWVGLPVAARDDRVKGLVGIAPPLEMYNFEFLKRCGKRKCLVVGDSDLYCPKANLDKFYGELDEPRSLHIIEGSDHFFTFHTRSLLAPLREFFRAEMAL